MKILGKCPYCNGKVEVRETILFGKKGKIYACSNAHWELDQDIFILTSESTCSWRIFSNALLKYNKRSISEKEIKLLLLNNELEVKLYARNPYFKKLEDGTTKKKHKEYSKFIIPNLEYGFEILWDD